MRYFCFSNLLIYFLKIELNSKFYMVTHVVKFDVPEAARPRKCWVWIQNRYLLRRSYMWIIYRRNLLFHSMKDVILNDKVGGAAGFASFKEEENKEKLDCSPFWSSS